MTVKAVLWDFGGVITSSPFEAFSRFEESNELPKDFIRQVNSTNPESNAWAQLESSQIDVEAFDLLFASEARSLGQDVSGSQVLALLSGVLRPEMIKALKIIKSKMKIGCITNNVKSRDKDAEPTEKSTAVSEVMTLFDVVIESSKVGIRKPDPEIYKLACREMGIEPGDALFLDDLGINLKPARALGMKTIKVLNAEQALDELEGHLKLKLR